MSARIPTFTDRPRAVSTPKLRALVKYPGNIVGTTGIEVTKAAGTVTITTDWTDFGAIDAIPTSPSSFILTFDTATNAYVLVPSHLLGGAVAGIADAVSDGVQYGRQSGNWTPTPIPATETPFIESGSGTVGVATKYAREDHVHPAATSGLTDAVSDGSTYGRLNGNWAKALPLSGGTLTGSLILNANPTVALGAATKGYVDGIVSSGGSFDSLAPTTTRGDIIYRNATVNTRLGAGTAGYLLQTNGTSADPSWSGFSQSAAFATVRTWQQKVAERVSILDFGGDGGGLVDNYLPLTHALAASNCVYFPPGNYYFTAGIHYTFPNNDASVVITGAGQDVTILTFAGSVVDGLYFAFITDRNTVHIRDMTIAASSAGGGTGIHLHQTAPDTSYSINLPMSDITNVTLRGSDAYQVAWFWSNGIYVWGISNVNFASVLFVGATTYGGVGLYTEGDTDHFPVQFNMFGCNFSGLNAGIVYGQCTQGLNVSSSNFTNCQMGIYVPASAALGLTQLIVHACQFNDAAYGISIAAPLPNTVISNNLFLIRTATTGVLISDASSTVITGNCFDNDDLGPSTTAIHFTGYHNLSSMVTGNSISRVTNGVWLGTGSQWVNVQSNSYSGVANTVFNSGTNNTFGGGSY